MRGENIADWRLEGTYFETCNCETACPCVWFQPPTEGDCKLLVAWHIEAGHHGEVDLSGLCVVLAIHSPGHMKDGDWKAALYLDQRADASQCTALTAIYAGKAGGHPALLMQFVGEVRGVRQVPIEYRAEGRTRRLRIPAIAAAEIESIAGVGGGEATISNPPLCVVPSHPAVVARSTAYRYTDHGEDWEFSERNGYHSPFVYAP